jgi:hypothetical protein
MTAIYAAMLSVLAVVADPEADLVARAERTQLLTSKGPFPRVEKDAEGNITWLRLDAMTLSAEEFTALSRLTTLRYLTLNKTNVTAANLRGLSGLTRLEGLQLNSTELGDDAMAELVKLPALRSVCLGNVAISPEAIKRLKDDFQSADRRLSLGYSQRKK